MALGTMQVDGSVLVAHAGVDFYRVVFDNRDIHNTASPDLVTVTKAVVPLEVAKVERQSFGLSTLMYIPPRAFKRIVKLGNTVPELQVAAE